MIREQWEALTHGPRPPGCSHKQNKSNLKAKIWMDYWRLCSINMKNSGAASTLALLHGRPSYWLHGCFLVLGEAWMEGFQIVSLCFWNHSCGLKKKPNLALKSAITSHLFSYWRYQNQECCRQQLRQRYSSIPGSLSNPVHQQFLMFLWRWYLHIFILNLLRTLMVDGPPDLFQAW